MRKKTLAAVIAAAMALGLFGCGSSEKTAVNEKTASADTEKKESEAPKDTDETEKQKGEEEQVTLKYTGWGAPTEKKAMEAFFAKFEEKHPNIKVDYVHIPTDYNTKLTTMMAAGEGPDVAIVASDTALQWATQGKFKNVLEMAEADPDFTLDNVLPQSICWWDEGKVCGLNPAIEVYCLMYNRPVLEEAGIEVPTKAEDAWTWEEFIEVLQKLTIDQNGKNAADPDFDPDNIKQFGIYLPTSTGANIVSSAIAQAEEDFLTEDGTAVNLSGTKTETALQNFADLINKYHVAPNPVQSKNLPAGATALQSGKTAMIWEGQWSLNELSENKADFGIGILPKMFDRPMTTVLGEPIVVFESTKHPEEAWELQKAFMDPDNILELFQNGLWMPTLKEWYENEDLVSQWASGNPAHPDGYIDAVLDNAFNNSMPALNYSVKNYPKIMDVFNPELDKVWSGEISVADAVKEVQDNMNKEVQGRYTRP